MRGLGVQLLLVTAASAQLYSNRFAPHVPVPLPTRAPAKLQPQPYEKPQPEYREPKPSKYEPEPPKYEPKKEEKYNEKDEGYLKPIKDEYKDEYTEKEKYDDKDDYEEEDYDAQFRSASKPKEYKEHDVIPEEYHEVEEKPQYPPQQPPQYPPQPAVQYPPLPQYPVVNPYPAGVNPMMPNAQQYPWAALMAASLQSAPWYQQLYGGHVPAPAVQHAPEPYAPPQPAPYVPAPAPHVPNRPAPYVPEPAPYVPQPEHYAPEPKHYAPESAPYPPQPAPYHPEPVHYEPASETYKEPEPAKYKPEPAYKEPVDYEPKTPVYPEPPVYPEQPQVYQEQPPVYPEQEEPYPTMYYTEPSIYQPETYDMTYAPMPVYVNVPFQADPVRYVPDVQSHPQQGAESKREGYSAALPYPSVYQPVPYQPTKINHRIPYSSDYASYVPSTPAYKPIPVYQPTKQTYEPVYQPTNNHAREPYSSDYTSYVQPTPVYKPTHPTPAYKPTYEPVYQPTKSQTRRIPYSGDYSNVVYGQPTPFLYGNVGPSKPHGEREGYSSYAPVSYNPRYAPVRYSPVPYKPSPLPYNPSPSVTYKPRQGRQFTGCTCINPFIGQGPQEALKGVPASLCAQDLGKCYVRGDSGCTDLEPAATMGRFISKRACDVLNGTTLQSVGP